MESNIKASYKMHAQVPNGVNVLFDPMRNVLVSSDQFNQFSSLPLSIAINNSVRRLKLSRHYSQRVAASQDNNAALNSNPNIHHATINVQALQSQRKRRNTVDNSSVANPNVTILKSATNTRAPKNSAAATRSMSLCVKRPTRQKESIRRVIKVKNVLNLFRVKHNLLQVKGVV